MDYRSVFLSWSYGITHSILHNGNTTAVTCSVLWLPDNGAPYGLPRPGMLECVWWYYFTCTLISLLEAAPSIDAVYADRAVVNSSDLALVSFVFCLDWRVCCYGEVWEIWVSKRTITTIIKREPQRNKLVLYSVDVITQPDLVQPMISSFLPLWPRISHSGLASWPCIRTTINLH